MTMNTEPYFTFKVSTRAFVSFTGLGYVYWFFRC